MQRNDGAQNPCISAAYFLVVFLHFVCRGTKIIRNRRYHISLKPCITRYDKIVNIVFSQTTLAIDILCQLKKSYVVGSFHAVSC